MEYILSAIVGALALLVAYLFRGKPGIHNNGSGAGGIRDSIADSKNRADDITDQIVDTSGTVADIKSHIDTAGTSIDRAIGIVQSIRRRGAKKNPVAHPRSDRD